MAKLVCGVWYQASILAKDGRLSNEKALTLISGAKKDIEDLAGPLIAKRVGETLSKPIQEFVQQAGGSLQTYSISGWLEHWLKASTDTKDSTRLEYRRSVDLLIKFLGARAKKPLSHVSSVDIEAFKDRLAKRLSPNSVNKQLRILRGAFKAAVAARQLDFSPAEHVAGLSLENEVERVPFSPDEVRSLLQHAKTDVKTWILVAVCTGLRSGDAANLRWQDLNFNEGSLSIETAKTGRRVIIPMVPELMRHLQAMSKPTDAKEFIMPSLAKKRSGWLSNQFHAVMVKAGLTEKRTHKKAGSGRDAKRAQTKQSFHSLRYSAISFLKAAGVSESVAMDITGHESKELSRHYTKIDWATKVAAMAKFPNNLL